MGNSKTPKLVYRYTKLGNEKLRFTASRLDSVINFRGTSQLTLIFNGNEIEVVKGLELLNEHSYYVFSI